MKPFVVINFSPLIFAFSHFCSLMCDFPEEHIQHPQLQGMTEGTGDCDRGLTVHVSCSLTVLGSLPVECKHNSQDVIFPVLIQQRRGDDMYQS